MPEFRALILGITGQLLPADLATPQFGQPDASLEVQTKDDLFRNSLLGQFETFIKDELFQTLCPGLSNNPSNALDRVAQEVTVPWVMSLA